MDIDFQSAWPVVQDWLVAHGIKIAFILIAAYIVQRVSGAFITRLIRRLVPAEGTTMDAEAEVKREDTLIQVFSGAAYVLLWLVALLMVLSEVGVAIGPLIAAAGIAGVAIGFGGQYLIRDIITGLFILIENQYRVGDVACFDSTCGLVEGITLRMTTLRDLDGTVHHVPHGEIKRASNLSKGYARVNLNVGVAYDSDIEHVIKVVNRVGEDLAKDSEWKNLILKAPQFLRIDNFGDSSIDIKILGDTRPIKQWEVTGELRKRLKIAFDKEGIEIPFPQRVIHTAKKEK
jgi:small conductance mechanosensitive channel